MSLFRPQYTDKKTGLVKHAKKWWYEFSFAGRTIRESAKTTSKTVAKEAEKKRRRELEEGFNGIADAREQRILTVRQMAQDLLQDYKIRQPKSARFAEYAIGHVSRKLGELMAVDITDKTIIRYQIERLKEGAAPKTINEEVSFLLRLLPITQAGALRAILRKQKKLKLKVQTRTGKAYSEQEKDALVTAAKAAPRSKAIHMATMLALHAGMRDKEIRTLQWNGFNLATGIVTVGQSKTDAGTGRTIPMNDELFSASVEYTKWYTARFGACQPDWYVFPFGRPVPSDPTHPQTSLKTAWRNVRKKAKVEGRFHDARHTFVTDLAESGAADEVIRDMAGHVDKGMLKHYSHIRTQAKRNAVAALVPTKTSSVEGTGKPATAPSDLGTVLQDSLQVELVN